MQRNQWFHKCTTILCIFSFFIMLAFSEDIPAYAQAGLKLWAFSVVPVLFPFIILSKLWIYFQVPENLIHTTSSVFKKKPAIASTLPLMLLGLGSGFPVGAIFIRYFYEQNTLSKRTAEHLLPLASFVSPMFLQGYVHTLLTGYMNITDIKNQWHIMLFCLYVPLIILYFVFIINDKSAAGVVSRIYSSDGTGSADSSLTVRQIWTSSLEIIFSIGIYMMLFSILLGLSGHLPLLKAMPFCILLANLEITTGCQYIISQTIADPWLKYSLLLALLEFGGICTMAQTASVISGSGLSMKLYVKIKLLAVGLSISLYLLLLTGNNYSSGFSFLSKSSLLLADLLLYPS